MGWDENGQAIYVIGVMVDIFELKFIELAFIESQQCMEFIFNVAKLGLWEWSYQVDEVFYNWYWGGMFGFVLEEIEFVLKIFFDFIYLEDVFLFEQAFNDQFKGKMELFEVEI